MTFQETFWAVSGTAAPVIALAAIVSVKELVKDSNAIMDPIRPYIGMGTDQDKTDVKKYMSHCDTVSGICIFGQLINVCLQAAALTVSLLCIANQRNVVPIWVGVAVPVAGVVWLAAADLIMMLAKETARQKFTKITTRASLKRSPSQE